MIFRKIILILFLIAFSKEFSKAQTPKPETGSFAVVELFTSEGCGTCPPADKLLSEIVSDARKNKKPVYAMEFHVDIWNRLGWKDPYSNSKFTFRQKNYSDALREMEVYTPQVFVNGNKPFVGSDKKKLLSEIDKELKVPPAIILKLSKNILSTSDTLLIDYESSKTDKNMNIYVALVQRNLVSKIGKGENAGKTLTHDNVVRVFENAPLLSQRGTIKIPVAKFKINADFSYRNFENAPLLSQRGTIKIPVAKFKINADFSIYGFVQQKLTKKILAATGFDLP